MAERIPMQFEVGGMAKAGNSAKQERTRLSQNTVVKPGSPIRVEARGGFVNSVDAGSAISRIVPFASQEQLMVLGATTSVFNDAGAWANLDATIEKGSGPVPSSCEAFEKLYCTYQNSAAGSQGRAFSYDADGVTELEAFETPITGSDIAAAISRIFVLSPKIGHRTLLSQWDLSGWALSNATFDGGFFGTYGWSGITFTTATGYIQSPTFSVGTERASVTWQQHLYNYYSVEQGVTLRIVDSATLSVLAEREIVLEAEDTIVGKVDRFTRYGLSVELPANATIKLQIVGSTDAVPAIAGASIMLGQAGYAGESDETGALVTIGSYFYTGSGIPDLVGTAGSNTILEEYDDRIMWCEPDFPKEWRSENFIDVSEIAGPGTALAVGRYNLVAFKERGMWVFKFTDNPDLPLAFVDFLPDFGCLNNRSYKIAFGRLFFMDNNTVYSWDFQGEPVQVVPPELQEYLFDPEQRSATPLLAVDTDARLLIIQIRTGLQHVLNLDTSEWTEWKVGTAGTNFTDLCFFGVSSDAYRKLYVGAGSNVSYNDKATATDAVGGAAASAYTATQWLKTVDSGHPSTMITLENITLDHLIESATTLSVDVSYDNGVTWSTNSVPIGATNLALGDDTEQTPVGLRYTGRRLTVRVTGPGPASKFSICGGGGDLLVRGKARQDKPTA